MEKYLINEKNRKGKLLLFIILLLAVISSSVTYAAASSYLEIKGTANIENYRWSVHFDNLENAIITGEAIENNKPSFNEHKTILSGIDITFKNPTDKIVYIFDIVNDGDFDAIISSIVVTNPICTSKSNNINNEKEFCDNLKYEIRYEDDTKLNIADSLDKKTSKKVKLVFEYLNTQFPSDIIEMDNISITIGYSQK